MALVEVFFDIETKKFFDEIEGGRDPAKLGVSIVSVYRREVDSKLRELRGEMKSFFPTDAIAMVGEGKRFFDEMWGWFEEADRIVGFNSLGFDVPALKPYYVADFAKLKHFDVLEKIRETLGRRVSLGAIAKETLGAEKLASGSEAVEWWAAGDVESLEKLRKYCEMDVEVTRDIYDFGLREGKLRFKDHWNELREVEVDFSYPKIEVKTESQMGLF
jgi:DEAD/DEAH box helicase domain-containing protein